MLILENNELKIDWKNLELAEKMGLVKNNKKTKIEFLKTQLEELNKIKNVVSKEDFKLVENCILKELKKLEWVEI